MKKTKQNQHRRVHTRRQTDISDIYWLPPSTNESLDSLSKLRGMQGACLLGETSGYVVDAKASKSISLPSSASEHSFARSVSCKKYSCRQKLTIY
jgi:hypothetical protein